MINDMFDGDIKLTALPLINLKYMVSNQLETRLGIELYKSSERLKGSVTSIGESGDNSAYIIDNKYAKSQAMFYPGVAYHFSKKNLLDVYVGAEIPIGWNNDKTVREEDGAAASITKNSFVIGLGAFIGLQANIADLPLAIGVEYGISSRFDTGLKYKNEFKGDGESQIYYTADLESFKHIDANDRFDNLKAKKGEIGSQFRLTLTYYFK